MDIKDYSLQNILAEAQKIQMTDFGKRLMNINTSLSYVNVVIFEKDYDNKEDGDLKNFTFYDFQDHYTRKAEWERMTDYYGQND